MSFVTPENAISWVSTLEAAMITRIIDEVSIVPSSARTTIATESLR